MEPTSPYRPSVSRETRRLFAAAMVAVAVLWLLARIEFQERPVTPNPVPAVLGQFARGPAFDDLAAEVAEFQSRVVPWLLVLDVPEPVRAVSSGSGRIGAIRLRDDLVVALLPVGSHPERWEGGRVAAHDPASGLLVLRAPVQDPAVSVPRVPIEPWAQRQLDQPRYLTASDVSARGVSIRPVFVGTLAPVESPFWPEPIWAVPGPSDLVPGSFLFTYDKELVGLVVANAAEARVLPGATLLAEAERLLGRAQGKPGTAGLDVQALTDAVASVIGASRGVVVTWVVPGGPAAGKVRVGEVIEAVDGGLISTHEHWDVRRARLRAGETLTLRVRTRGEVREVTLVATEAPPGAAGAGGRPTTRPLGLTLRRRAGTGAEVVRVERDSASDRAGLQVGDVITLIADVQAPTPAQVARSFATRPGAQGMLIAVTRGHAHQVMTLEP